MAHFYIANGIFTAFDGIQKVFVVVVTEIHLFFVFTNDFVFQRCGCGCQFATATFTSPSVPINWQNCLPSTGLWCISTPLA